MKFYKKSEPITNPAFKLQTMTYRLCKLQKFLGLMWGNKLTWAPHIEQLKHKCRAGLNLMKIISGPSWGADQETLVRTYRVIIRPKLDYGCVVYGSANAQQLKSIDVIVTEAMKIATGAFKTTPIATLHILMNEPLLNYRRENS